MVRSPSIDKNGLRRGQWSKEEDDKLRAYIERYGIWNWRQLPNYAGLSRCGKSCRLRWKNYLQPNVKRGNYTKEEEDIIVNLHEQLGKKWSIIAKSLPGRTDNEIKNYWHTHLKKRTKNPSNNEMVNSSEGSLKKPESTSTLQTSKEEMKPESSQYYDNDQEQISTTPRSQGLISPNESFCSAFSHNYSDAPFTHDRVNVNSFESPQGSCSSELSLNSTFSSLSDLMSWNIEDSNIIMTSFESLDYYWGTTQTFNHEISAHHNEGQLANPGFVCPGSPSTEDIVLWSW